MPELMSGEYISDQQDQSEYYGHDATHCEHGTFVGGWDGPDYLCQWCEDGVALEEYQAIGRERESRAFRHQAVWDHRAKVIVKYHDAEETGAATQAQFDDIVRATIWLVKRDTWKGWRG
jgi:hypothetical protein